MAQTQTDLDQNGARSSSEQPFQQQQQQQYSPEECEFAAAMQVALIAQDLARTHRTKVELPATCQQRLTVNETLFTQINAEIDTTHFETLRKIK